MGGLLNPKLCHLVISFSVTVGEELQDRVKKCWKGETNSGEKFEQIRGRKSRYFAARLFLRLEFLRKWVAPQPPNPTRVTPPGD